MKFYAYNLSALIDQAISDLWAKVATNKIAEFHQVRI